MLTVTEQPPHTRTIRPAVEHDTALPLKTTKAVSITPAGETDSAMPLTVKKAAEIVSDIIGAPVQLAGASHGTSSASGTLTVTAAQGSAAGVLPRVTQRATGYVMPPSAFVPRRQLSGGEWAALAVVVEGIAEIAVRDYGVTAGEALSVRLVAFIVLAALISRFPRNF